MKTSTNEYALLDFGKGRKLERFGDWILDRLCPAADHLERATPGKWKDATARFGREHAQAGRWVLKQKLPAAWCVKFPLPAKAGLQELTFELNASPFGHIGLFVEQVVNWQWIAKQVAQAKRPPKVLNLFAYTGGSTLAAAAAGAEVVHIDAARNTVDRARRNAELSGLQHKPVRWIVEDALRFCRREVQRDNRYDAVILDPPSYGHGPQGEVWKIDRHLPELLELCGELTARKPLFVLATCHSPGIGPAELAAYVAAGFFGDCRQPPVAGQLYLETEAGRRLHSGIFARWPG